MSATRKCRGCGADVPVNAPFGHCPKCLLELGFGVAPEPRPPSPSRQRAFGDYELIEEIGRGGMGIIYKARQITLNRLVALKMIKPAEFASPSLIERFHIEAEAAANLHHPNIVSIYETGEYRGQHFFSMELIDGLGLDRFIAEGGFVWGEEKSTRARHEQVAHLTTKLARAIDYAHQHGVLHRDLKPSNILVDKRGEPHLTDFGVAKVIGNEGNSLTASGAIMGTPSYMAPEQAAGKSKRVTTAADVYSLGAILYAMLTGQPPFQADTPVETLKQVVEQDPKHPTTFKDGVDHDLATICMKCLEKEPQRRYASAAALVDELERWLRREPILARPVGAVSRVIRWCRREPVIAGLVAGIAVCLVVMTVFALWAYRNAERDRSNQAAAQREMQSLTRQLLEDQPDASWSISSEQLAMLTGRLPKKEGIRIAFGAYTHTAASDMFPRFAPILSYLETNTTMEVSLRIDFIIYRGYSNAVDALVMGKVGFMRPGPASYITARQRMRGLRVLCNQVHDGHPIIHGVVFTRSDSEIDRVRDLVGKSVASADEESTFGNYVPKAFLFDQGLRMRDIKKWIYVGAHDETVRQVIDGNYDIGTANSNVVAKFMQEGAPLKVLHHMKSISFPWVASTNVAENVIQAIQRSLLSIQDPAILKKIDKNLDRFAKTGPEHYDQFEQGVIDRAEAFEK